MTDADQAEEPAPAGRLQAVLAAHALDPEAMSGPVLQAVAGLWRGLCDDAAVLAARPGGAGEITLPLRLDHQGANRELIDTACGLLGVVVVPTDMPAAAEAFHRSSALRDQLTAGLPAPPERLRTRTPAAQVEPAGWVTSAAAWQPQDTAEQVLSQVSVQVHWSIEGGTVEAGREVTGAASGWADAVRWADAMAEAAADRLRSCERAEMEAVWHEQMLRRLAAGLSTLVEFTEMAGRAHVASAIAALREDGRERLAATAETLAADWTGVPALVLPAARAVLAGRDDEVDPGAGS